MVWFLHETPSACSKRIRRHSSPLAKRIVPLNSAETSQDGEVVLRLEHELLHAVVLSSLQTRPPTNHETAFHERRGLFFQINWLRLPPQHLPLSRYSHSLSINVPPPSPPTSLAAFIAFTTKSALIFVIETSTSTTPFRFPAA